MINKGDQYLNFLMSRTGSRALKIPCTLSARIIQDPKKLKAICVWLCLKPLFYNGEIRKVRQNLPAVAKCVGISPGALRYKLKELENMGLISRNPDGNLFLRSWQTLFKYYGINRPGRFKFYRFKDEFDPYSVELIIRRLALEEQLKKQDYEIEQKIFKSALIKDRQAPVLKALDQIFKANIAVEDRQRISQKYIDQLDAIQAHDFKAEKSLKRKIKKSGLFSFWHTQAIRAYHKQRAEFDVMPEINTDVSISCQKTANIFGMANKSSGHYWQRRLVKAGLMKVYARAIPLEKDSQCLHRFYFEQQIKGMKLHHFVGSKGIWKRLNNLFEFTNLAYL